MSKKQEIASLKYHQGKMQDDIYALEKRIEALNKTYELSILNRTEYKHQKPNQIEVPFWLGASNEVWLGDDITICISAIWNYCRLNNIDQTKIERITLTMKSEEE